MTKVKRYDIKSKEFTHLFKESKIHIIKHTQIGKDLNNKLFMLLLCF